MKISTLTLLALLTLGVAACSNTFEGVGQDMEDTGEWIQDKF